MNHLETIRQYIEDISKYRYLTRERELDLIEKAQKNNKEALDELINSNLWCVVHIVQRYYLNAGIEDHIQNGNLGLLKALTSYSPTKRFQNGKPARFRTYAASWVWKHISQNLPKEIKLAKRILSLDEKIADDETLNLKSNLQTDIKTQEEIDLTDEKRYAIKLLNYLNERERKVMEMRYGIGYNKAHSLREIGDQFNLTRERIRQIEGKALRKLRESI